MDQIVESIAFDIDTPGSVVSAVLERQGDDVVVMQASLGGPEQEVGRLSFAVWTSAAKNAWAHPHQVSSDEIQEGEEPLDTALVLVGLGWRVDMQTHDSRVCLIATPQVDGSVDVEAHLRAVGLDPGSVFEFAWRRPDDKKDDWTPILEATGAREPSGVLVQLDEDEMDVLSILLASAWVSPDFGSARSGWHSEAGHTPTSFLSAEFLANAGKRDAARIADDLEAVRRWVTSNGFTGPFETPGDVKAYLAGSQLPTVGHYAVELGGRGSCYIGETINLPSRLNDHRRTYGDAVTNFYIRPDHVAASVSPRKAQKSLLREQERILIHSAQDARMVALNFNEMAHPINERPDFAEAISPLSASTWFADPVEANLADDTPLRGLLSTDYAGQLANFRKLAVSAEMSEVSEIVGSYLERCVPYPARTELLSWSVSCLPKSQRGTRGDRVNVLACVSISMPEVLTLLQSVETGQSGGFVAVNNAELGYDDDLQLVRLLRRHPGVFIDEGEHREFGPGVSFLNAPSLSAMHRLLDDVEVTRAAAT